jgi:RHS repeat-associated protein
MDRLTTKTTPEGTLSYTFTPTGKVATIASSNVNGATVAYTYDSIDRLSTVIDNRLPSGSNTTTYTYDGANNVATAIYPNGVESTFTYDQLNRVTGLSSPVSGYTYQRGPTGNLTNVTEQSGRAASWTYDGIYRLTNETISLAPSGNNGSIGYGLDPVGNRTSVNSAISGLAPIAGTFNADDELSSETYDANGNVLSEGGKTFSYDSENHLIAMNGGAVSIIYDAFGNRVAKTANGVTTKYLVEDDVNPTGYPQVLEEVVGTTAQRTYTYGLQRISEYQTIGGSWTASFYGYDGGGNVRKLTNSAGAVTDSYEYDAFGNSFTVNGSTPNNYLYRGEQFDPDLGLYYLRARYMNPLTGRFMSRDPEDGDFSDPKTLHKYLYTGGDPVNGWDPTGRDIAIGYAQLTLWDVGKTFAKAASLSGVLDCMFEFILTKFDGAIETAVNGGTISQVGPCVWLAVNLQKALPKPAAPAVPVPGTKLSPWTPQCDELGAAVQAAKATANSLGKCSAGMSPWQLQVRYDAWVALGAARAQFNMVCWGGGDRGHQQADADAWFVAGNCAMLKAAF